MWRNCLITFQHFLYPQTACKGEKDSEKDEREREQEGEEERTWGGKCFALNCGALLVGF